MLTKRLITILFLTVLAAAAVSGQEAKAATELIKDLRPLTTGSQTGRPVLVNFWATWCGPCRVEFPDLVEIDSEFRSKGLDFILVSVDRPTFADTMVPEFLEQYKATMPSYLLDFWERRDKARAIRQIAPGFRDGYPTTLLFDSGGRLVYSKTGRIDPKILRAKIGKVLPKGPTTNK